MRSSFFLSLYGLTILSLSLLVVIPPHGLYPPDENQEEELLELAKRFESEDANQIEPDFVNIQNR